MNRPRSAGRAPSPGPDRGLPLALVGWNGPPCGRSARVLPSVAAGRARRGPDAPGAALPLGDDGALGLDRHQLVAGGALAYIPVTDYIDLRGELRQLEEDGAQLQLDLDDANRTVRVAESRNAERARCYANYVVPGRESYSIPGSSGCVQ